MNNKTLDLIILSDSYNLLHDASHESKLSYLIQRIKLMIKYKMTPKQALKQL